MPDKQHFISIWFFIGTLLFIYGLLILGSDLYQLFNPPAHPVVLNRLHAGTWWGGLLIVLGAVYCYRFFPGKS
jgi:hypothetical protein